MSDKDKDKNNDNNPIFDFGKIFVSAPDILENSDDDVDYDELDIAPISSLFDDIKGSNDKNASNK